MEDLKDTVSKSCMFKSKKKKRKEKKEKLS